MCPSRMRSICWTYARVNGEHLSELARRLMTDRYSRLLLVADLAELMASPPE